MEDVCSEVFSTQRIQRCCDAIHLVQTLLAGGLMTVFDRYDTICMYIKFKGNVAKGIIKKVTYSLMNRYSVMMDIINSRTEKLWHQTSKIWQKQVLHTACFLCRAWFAFKSLPRSSVALRTLSFSLIHSTNSSQVDWNNSILKHRQTGERVI